MTDRTLYVFPTDPGAFNLSPFCTKAEILLQLAGLTYELKVPDDHTAFPKQKLPVLMDGETMVEDSEFIRWHLQEKYNASFLGTTHANKRALQSALCRMLENHTYLLLVYTRWVDAKGWALTRAHFFGELDDAIAEGIRGQMRKCFDHSLLSRHEAEDLRAMLDADLHTLACALGENPYFCGEAPGITDAIAFGILVNFLEAPEQTWAKELAGSHANITQYVARGLKEWYPHYSRQAAA